MKQRTFAEVFNHLEKVLQSERFLLMRGLNNDLPFYICEYPPSQAAEMQTLPGLLRRQLEKVSPEALGGRSIRILEVNLYDVCIELLRNRPGRSAETSLWDDIIRVETELDKSALLELLQNVLGVSEYLVPAIAGRLKAEDHDILFLTGIGEVFPYIRSHNVLNNLQSTAKEKPTVMFFPGLYTQSQISGASLDLFGRLRDDKYYRAFNIYHCEA